MAKIIDIDRRRRKPKAPKAPEVTEALLWDQIDFLKSECADHVTERVQSAELLEGLPFVFARLVAIVPAARRAELSRAICFVSHEMPLTAANLRVVLICAMVLADQYTAESAA